MRGLMFDRFLATTALVLALGLPAQAGVTSEDPKATSPEAASATQAAPAAPAAQTAPAAEPAPAATAPEATTPATTTPATTTPASAPATATPADKAAADPALVEQLREMLPKSGRFFARANERTAAEDFYKARDFAPLWIKDGAFSPRANAAIAYLKTIEAEGLNPADYPAPELGAGTPEQLAEAELRLTGEMLEFARHAQIGRVHYSRISGDIHFEGAAPEPAAILKQIADSTDLVQLLASYHPQHPQYQALRAKLAAARSRSEVEVEIVRVPEGPMLKAGMNDPRVSALRKRLKTGDGSNTQFDDDLVQAVKAFQKGAGLNADGIAGPGTLRALNATPKREREVDVIIANMERWRWMPRDLGNRYVMVNIPDFTLKIVKDGTPYWKTNIVVGKPSQPTPITMADMKFITVNPTWNVPPSIIANEYLPALREDPEVLARMGLRMEQNQDGTVRIYQPPGDRNALGRIRFNFPNKFLVYQHDTPDKHLFAHEKRAYSHGCMRVENPLMYGEKLLSLVRPDEGYSQEKLRAMFGGGEVNINFPETLPVYLTYQTAFVDESGNLVIREDIYGRDAATIAQFKDDNRKVADIAIQRSHTGSGVSRAALQHDMREESTFADWFSSRSRKNKRGGTGPTDPVGEFFGRLFNP